MKRSDQGRRWWWRVRTSHPHQPAELETALLRAIPYACRLPAESRILSGPGQSRIADKVFPMGSTHAGRSMAIGSRGPHNGETQASGEETGGGKKK